MSIQTETANTDTTAFERLVKIVRELRKKCPWDKKQTFESLRYLTIEETYELADAILDSNQDGIKEEIGDLMMHMIFYAVIGEEQRAFNLTDALNHICDKLVSRHPHVYSDLNVESAEEVKKNWEQLKLKEGKKSIFEGVPLSLPAVVKATRIQEKARQVGFDWDNKEQVWDKVNEEISELQTEITKEDNQRIESEFGDLLFALINYARFLNVDPESALERTNKRFISRFNKMEKLSKQKGTNLKDMSLEEMEALWQKSKKL